MTVPDRVPAAIGLYLIPAFIWMAFLSVALLSAARHDDPRPCLQCGDRQRAALFRSAAAAAPERIAVMVLVMGLAWPASFLLALSSAARIRKEHRGHLPPPRHAAKPGTPSPTRTED